MRSTFYILLPFISILGSVATHVPTPNDQTLSASDTLNVPPSAPPQHPDLIARQVHNADYGSSSPHNPNSGSTGSGSTTGASAAPSSVPSDASGKNKSARGFLFPFPGFHLPNDHTSPAPKAVNKGNVESRPLDFIHSRSFRWKRKTTSTLPALADADVDKHQMDAQSLPRSSKAIAVSGGWWYKRIFMKTRSDGSTNVETESAGYV